MRIRPRTSHAARWWLSTALAIVCAIHVSRWRCGLRDEPAFAEPTPRRSATLGTTLGSLGCIQVAAAERPTTLRFKQIISEAGLENWQVKDYEAMRDDVPRTSKFKAAIQRRVASIGEGATVVDIGTGPFALLAIFAARAGARKVYAIEKNAAAAALARETVVKEGLADRVQVIEGDSMKTQLPEQVDLIVSELIGSIATQEGVTPIIQDAGKRFLKESVVNGMIPARCQTCVVPIHYKISNGLSKIFKNPFAAGVRSRGIPAQGTSLPLRINAADESSLIFLSEPQFLEDFDYNNPGIAREMEKDLTFQVSDSFASDKTYFSGFAMWTRVVVDDSNVVEVRGQPDSHWAYVVPLLTQNAARIDPGTVRLRCSVDYASEPIRYTFDATVPNHM